MANPEDYLYLNVKTNAPQSLVRFLNWQNKLVNSSIHGSLKEPIRYKRVSQKEYYLYTAWETYIFGTFNITRWVPFFLYFFAFRISMKVKGKFSAKVRIIPFYRVAFLEVKNGLVA